MVPEFEVKLFNNFGPAYILYVSTTKDDVIIATSNDVDLMFDTVTVGVMGAVGNVVTET
jgi:hypothetical protein